MQKARIAALAQWGADLALGRRALRLARPPQPGLRLGLLRRDARLELLHLPLEVAAAPAQPVVLQLRLRQLRVPLEELLLRDREAGGELVDGLVRLVDLSRVRPYGLAASNVPGRRGDHW